MLTATGADGTQVFSNTYDKLGRVIVQDDAVAGNQVTNFSYDEKSQPGNLITTVTDRNGQTRVLTHNSSHQLISVKDELDNCTYYTYDAAGNRTGAVDARGKTISYAYDERGNLLQVTDPASNTAEMTYDDRNNLLSVQNPEGRETVCTYDQNNNLTSVTDYAGQLMTITGCS